MSRRNFTIDDVAREAGVARVTVSRVLNNVQNVRPETRERVRRAVEALGYSVNRQARALASGSGTQIMLIHAHNPEREPNSFYNAGLELGALRACSSLGFDLVTRAIDPASESPARLLASILEHERPAGIVVSPPLSDDLELLACAQAGERADGRPFRLASAPASMVCGSRDRRTRSRRGRSAGTSPRSGIAAWAFSKGRPNTGPRRFATTASSTHCATPGIDRASRGPRPAISPFDPAWMAPSVCFTSRAW